MRADALKLSHRSKTNLVLGAILIMAFLAAAVLMTTFRPPQRAKTLSPYTESASKTLRGKKLPAFTLTERSGKKITDRDLHGKVWVADFIFTRCDVACPTMTSRMTQLQSDFRNHPDLRLVSFSVDPEWDNPEKLSAYADRFGADTENWFFLTGNRKTIYDLAQDYFILGVGVVSEEDRQKGAEAFLHSQRFVLVGKDGRVINHYNSTDGEAMDRLVSDLGILLKP